LLAPEKQFLRSDGSIEVQVDFTIKSSTFNHLAREELGNGVGKHE
jgi:hypothetical protein